MRNFNNSYSKFVFDLSQINEAAAKYPEEFVMSMENKYKEEISNTVVKHLELHFFSFKNKP